MLKQASVDQIRNGGLKPYGYLVITMCFYPRGVKKTNVHEYSGQLAPDAALLRDFKAHQQKLGHNEAFGAVQYENRFTLSDEALAQLSHFSKLSHTHDVYFICQCEVGERCHRELLLLTARTLFQAETAKIFNDYPTYQRRLNDMRVHK